VFDKKKTAYDKAVFFLNYLIQKNYMLNSMSSYEG